MDRPGSAPGSGRQALPRAPGTETDPAAQSVQARLERAALLEAENLELRNFNSRLAHEVRAQLRVIDGMSAILLSQDGQALDAAAVRMLKLIRASAARLGHTTDDLLALAQVAQQPLRRETVDLGKLARSIATVLLHANPQRDVRLTVAPDLWVAADPGLLRLALSNLIGNAWKFTRNVEVAEIEVGRQIVDGEAVFFIRDNGAGFNMKHAGRLFEPFTRLHRQEEFDGTGIGLSLVRKIVERHQGSIWARAVEGNGATFFFSLGAGA